MEFQCLPSIGLKSIDEYAELNSAKKAPKEGGNFYFLAM